MLDSLYSKWLDVSVCADSKHTGRPWVMLVEAGSGMSVESDAPVPVEAAPRCENGMIFLKEARARVTRVADQGFTWCVQAWYPCCENGRCYCLCDPCDLLFLCLACASDDD
jgi:hypothetical protein